MRIGIIDADLLGRSKHRFPNLACEKISSYWKSKKANVKLLMDYNNLNEYDKVYVSKVFTDTPVPDFIFKSDHIQIGGTGFYFDRAPNLPDKVEHCMPDYYLYHDWINSKLQQAKEDHAKSSKPFNQAHFLNQFREYTDYSIGFITRGCFRKCGFCINRKYNHVFKHSPVYEFYDTERPKICLLDDNVLGCSDWRIILEDLINLNKPYKFKQGLDERLLTKEKCDLLFNSKYDGDFTFAFDNIEDYDIIRDKLEIIRECTDSTRIKFYVLVGFKGTDLEDIENMWKRVELLMKYKCLPYIMRYQDKDKIPWKTSKYKGMYIAVARWCNQPSLFKKKSFREFCQSVQSTIKTKGFISAPMRALIDFEKAHPDIAKRYFDLKYE